MTSSPNLPRDAEFESQHKQSWIDRVDTCFEITMSRTVLCPRKRANADDPAPLEALRSNDIPVNTGLVQRGKKRRRSKLCCSQRKRWKVEDVERDEEQRAASAWEEEEGQSSSTSPASVSNEGDSPEGVSPEDSSSEEGVSSEDSSSEEGVSPEDSSSEEGVSPEDSSSEEGVSSEEWSEELDTESDDDVLNDTTLRRVLELLYEEQDCLGEGGYGSVFAGIRREDGLPVAIKHIPADHVTRTTVVSSFNASFSSAAHE
ncbi:RNA polymerase II-associated factor 1 homolog [Hoplias malabaricus]|uniref:RNA polymerase II-associated factor 1 homolog n=1 Tax=Hoplias malabaricus TaxID=27720 RepID=UPI0034622EB2